MSIPPDPSVPVLIAKVRELAAADPRHIDPRGNAGPLCEPNCKYTPGPAGEPACIFGQAFVGLGYTVEQLAVFDEVSGSGTTIEEVLPALGFDPTFAEASWLSDVQYAQDSQLPWAKAVEDADAAGVL